MKWLPIEGYPNYEISDEGVVKNINTGLILKQNTKKGTHKYKRVHLCCDGKSRYHLVHRLVLEAFVGPCPEGQQTLHEDDNPANNRLDNLRWGTPKENHKTICREGVLNGRAKLTEDDVRAIRASTEPHRILAELYKVAEGYISQIKKGATWRHIQPA